MALAKLIVGGFKSLKDPVEIPLAPITLLFGPNSVGKSVVRDALTELRRRLAVERVNDRLGASLARLTGGAQSSSMAHQLPRDDELDELDSTSVLLGCEDEEFQNNGTTTMAAENEWSDLGRDLYWSLQGKTVKYTFVDTFGDWSVMHELTVDGVLLLSHLSTELDQELEDRPNLPNVVDGLGYPRLEGLGTLRLNRAHPIADEPRLRTLIDQLTAAATRMGPAWADRVVWMDGDVLHVRVESYRRLCQNWADPIGDGFRFGSDRPIEWSAINGSLGALCYTVNELIRQLEFSLEQELHIALVPGSRTLISEEMATANWFSGAFGIQDDSGGHTVAHYARWLGETSVDEGELPWVLKTEVRSRDDFVNDCLGAHLLAARRYKVKAEVSLREERMALPRDATWSTDPERTMKSTLFLLDQQGRALDFDQVGSGVSYVLPVLTALWGAGRSLIEQPELHLHPSAQCEMGDVIVRAFNRGRFSIVETHSEHLLLRILRRVRQTSEGKVEDRELQCQPEAIAVLYFSPQPDGSTQVHQLRVTRGGDFMDRWPDGFFEERSRELFDE
jgi:predicted ATPase